LIDLLTGRLEVADQIERLRTQPEDIRPEVLRWEFRPVAYASVWFHVGYFPDDPIQARRIL
jgi:hypothetical protein